LFWSENNFEAHLAFCTGHTLARLSLQDCGGSHFELGMGTQENKNNLLQFESLGKCLGFASAEAEVPQHDIERLRVVLGPQKRSPPQPSVKCQ
jgi:hypothetical protein